MGKWHRLQHYNIPMPILIILLLAAACLPVAWPRPVFELAAPEVTAVAGAFVLGSLLMSLLVGLALGVS